MCPRTARFIPHIDAIGQAPTPQRPFPSQSKSQYLQVLQRCAKPELSIGSSRTFKPNAFTRFTAPNRRVYSKTYSLSRPDSADPQNKSAQPGPLTWLPQRGHQTVRGSALQGRGIICNVWRDGIGLGGSSPVVQWILPMFSLFHVDCCLHELIMFLAAKTGVRFFQSGHCTTRIPGGVGLFHT